jgi:hypothetical protein
MKKIACFFMVLMCAILAGCATTGTELQAACQKQFDYFPSMYDCTHSAIAAKRPQVFENQYANLYMLKGAKLAQDVKSGEISSQAASIQWQKDFIATLDSIDRQNRSDMAPASAILMGAGIGLTNFAAATAYRPYYPPPGYGYGYTNYQQPTQTRCHTSSGGYTQCQTW